MDWPADIDRLIELADGYLFDESSPEEFAELEQAILNCPEARDVFWERVQWHASVREFCKQRPVVRFAKELARSDAAQPEAVAPGQQTEAGVPSAPLMGEGSAISPSARMREGSVISPSPLLGEGRGEGSSAKPVKSPVLGFLGGVVD